MIAIYAMNVVPNWSMKVHFGRQDQWRREWLLFFGGLRPMLNEYQTISHLFSVGISTTCNIVHEVCKAILDSLLHKYIKTPVGSEAMDIVRGFGKKWGFPQCLGAVDGSHIPILLPSPWQPHWLLQSTGISFHCVASFGWSPESFPKCLCGMAWERTWCPDLVYFVGAYKGAVRNTCALYHGWWSHILGLDWVQRKKFNTRLSRAHVASRGICLWQVKGQVAFSSQA